MSKWEKYSDYMYVNEIDKEVVFIQVYGHNDEYFLSQSGNYELDPYEEIELDVVINTDNNPSVYDSLVNKTKDMRGIDV